MVMGFAFGNRDRCLKRKKLVPKEEETVGAGKVTKRKTMGSWTASVQTRDGLSWYGTIPRSLGKVWVKPDRGMRRPCGLHERSVCVHSSVPGST
jgi:hypothetical protein